MLKCLEKLGREDKRKEHNLQAQSQHQIKSKETQWKFNKIRNDAFNVVFDI